MVKMCKWSRDTLEYDGSCSHGTLREAVSSEFSLSAEELEAKATEILERAKEYQYDYYTTAKAKLNLSFWIFLDLLVTSDFLCTLANFIFSIL
jgi:hypothetical protein